MVEQLNEQIIVRRSGIAELLHEVFELLVLQDSEERFGFVQAFLAKRTLWSKVVGAVGYVGHLLSIEWRWSRLLHWGSLGIYLKVSHVGKLDRERETRFCANLYSPNGHNQTMGYGVANGKWQVACW